MKLYLYLTLCGLSGIILNQLGYGYDDGILGISLNLFTAILLSFITRVNED